MKPHKNQLGDLIKIYHDLERTLRGLRLKTSCGQEALKNIDVRKLILQLKRSKRRLEQKIGNTLLVERQHLRRRLIHLADAIGGKEEQVQ